MVRRRWLDSAITLYSRLVSLVRYDDPDLQLPMSNI
jgi:hypothetical protein